MKLFVGLGNPGSEYARKRHNVGFMAVERIAATHGFPAWKKRFHGLTCEGRLGRERVVLLKPQTFMNDSGRSVGEAQRFSRSTKATSTSSTTSSTWRPASCKVKTGGGNAGHNGLRSITAHIGNDYARVRIGIGHPGSKEQVVRHVLHDFAKADRGLARAAARCHRRRGAAARRRGRRALPHRCGAHAERKRAPSRPEPPREPETRRSTGRAPSRRAPPSAPWPRTSSDG